MTCDIRLNSIDYLKNKGVLNEYMFVQSSAFFTENDRLTDLARTKYGVLNSGRLFNTTTLRSGTVKAVINEEFADELQTKHTAFHNNRDFLQVNEEVQYVIKAVDIVSKNIGKIQQWEQNKSIPQSTLEKKIQELGVPKDQLALLLASEGNNISEKLASFMANYSYTIEINTAKKNPYRETKIDQEEVYQQVFGEGIFEPYSEEFNKEVDRRITKIEDEYGKVNSDYYSNLTVPGGINYTENEIATPAIIPSIKGHAQFSTDNGIGWFRSDDKEKSDKALVNGYFYYTENDGETTRFVKHSFNSYLNKNKEGKQYISAKKYGEAENKYNFSTKTRRILEVQSDLFQKGRGKEELTDIKRLTNLSEVEEKELSSLYFSKIFGETLSEKEQDRVKELEKKETFDYSSNNFLQLLNKDNNWVTFFIKSIIQDSAKKGYEKVLFPTGNTASKVEGHSTLETYKGLKETRLKTLELQKEDLKDLGGDGYKNFLRDYEYDKIVSAPSYAIVEQNVFGQTRYDLREYVEGRYDTYDNYETKEEAENIKKVFEQKANTDVENAKRLLENPSELVSAELAKLDREIAQLKTELEDLDTRGFGALKPIYNFYENTVANVLKKQGYSPKLITDEHGNTWQEVEVSGELAKQQVFLNLKEQAEQSFSPQVLAKVNEFLERIGVDKRKVQDIVVNGQKMNANGVAKMLQGIIEYVDGKESAIPEEAMHFAVEILEQTNETLFNQMLNRVADTSVYKEIFSVYAKNPLYQIDGKPNVRKIKKEAIARKLVEVLIEQDRRDSDTTTNFFVDAWVKFVNWFKQLFAKANFNPFEVAVNKILTENIGTVADITSSEEFLQIAEPTDVQKNIVNRLRSTGVTKQEDGYYVNGAKLPKRVTDFAKAFYERIFGDGDLGKSEYQKLVDDIKRESGTKGHLDIEHIFNLFVDPETGAVRDTELQDNYTPLTNPVIYNTLKDNMRQRIATFEKGSIFLNEVIVHDNQVGGTIDLLVVSPTGKVSILDWKFMDLDIKNYTDVPWYKKKAWRIQIAKYKSLLQKSYGVKDSDFLKTEVVPIKAEYAYNMDIDGVSKPRLNKIIIGEPTLSSETRDYLLPVALETQSTGDKQLDRLIKKLIGLRGTLEDAKAKTPTEKVAKAEQLNALERAVRHLQIRKSVEPLIEQATVYTKDIENLFSYYDTIKDKNFRDIDKEVLSDFGLKLDKAFNDLNIYTDLDIELQYLFKGNLTAEQKKTQDEIRGIVLNARNLLSELKSVTDSFGEKVANAYGSNDITRVEKQVSSVSKLFSATSKLQTKTLEVFYKMRREAQNLMDFHTNEENNKLLEIKKAYDVLAKSRGWGLKDYFNIIKKKDSNQLIDQFDKEFYIELKKRVKDKDYLWIQDNVDIDAFKTKLAEERAVKLEYLKNRMYAGDAAQVARMKKRDLDRLNQEFDLSTASSIGWYKHRKLMRQFPKAEKWTTEEWKTLHKQENKAALDLYNWIIATNKKAAQTGYISNRDFGKTERLFLPYVPKTFTEKLVWGGNVSLMSQFIRNMTIDETTVGYGQIDPVTGKLVNKIPVYFVSDGGGMELSEDLFKNLALYNESVNRYKQLSEIEGIALALGRVERNKQSIITSSWGKPKYDSISESFEVIDNNDKNADLYDKQVATLVYGQKYVNSETFDQLMGNVDTVFKKLNSIIGRDLFPTDLSDRQLSLNKSIDTLNNYFQQKTLGLNPLPSITNLLGGNFNAIINAGTFFTKEDFVKSEMEITANGISFNTLMGEDGKKFLAALDYFQPYTDDTNRDMLKELSVTKMSNIKIQDALFWMMRTGDRLVQSSIFLANLRNQVIIDGNVVNAREYLRKQPEYANRYNNPETLSKVEKEFNEKVEKLIEEKGVLKLSTVVDGKLVIPGVDRISENTFKVRNITRELTKKALGNLSAEEVRGVQQNVYLRSMMVFKNWIPNLVDVRFGELKYNSALDAWEWGRARTLARYISMNGIKSLMNVIDVLRANEVGIKSLNEMYEYKKRTYKEATGRDLEMTEAEFYDMVRQNISGMAKDALITISVMAMLVAAGMVAPDDDDEYGKNVHKFTLKALDKVKDELFFFYNPASLNSVLNGSIFPSLGVLTDGINIINHFTTEIYGFSFDEELQEKNHVIKYVLKSLPIASQISAYMPLYAPDLAKDLGIKMNTQSRMR